MNPINFTGLIIKDENSKNEIKKFIERAPEAKKYLKDSFEIIDKKAAKKM